MSVALTGINPTLLNITPLSGDGGLLLPPYGARALTQTLEKINSNSASALFRRSIRGRMIDMSSPVFRLYQSTVSWQDGTPPSLDDAWLGCIVQMDCAVELAYPTGGTPQRTGVSGSSRVEGWMTYYRPTMLMMLTGMRQSFGEYTGLYSISLDFQELEPSAP
jgi:hypothetical protein